MNTKYLFGLALLLLAVALLVSTSVALAPGLTNKNDSKPTPAQFVDAPALPPIGLGAGAGHLTDARLYRGEPAG